MTSSLEQNAPPLVLAADTATRMNAVALCRGGEILAETLTDGQRTHAERLMDMAAWVLREGGASLEAVDLLAISTGPGSFTGLRIGVSAWKGLALARGIPLIGVPTLDAMTLLAGMHDGMVCPMLDARMKEVFAAVYRFRDGEREKIRPDAVCPAEAVIAELEGPALFLGDGAEAYREQIQAALPEARFAPAHCSVPRAAAVAAEALALAAAGADGVADQVEPVYLRLSQAEMNQQQAQPA